jgi:branched-chain amino acid transport system substrate-binding protein
MWAKDSSAARLAGAALAAAAVTLASGCGGSSSDAIRIGVLFDCEEQFASASEQFMAGAELPLVVRGAHLRGTLPSKGIEGGSVAGRKVELVTRCERAFSRASTVAALRLLVEKDGADVVVGLEGPADGLVIRDYAKRHPGVTFVYSGFDGAATLVDPAPNVFRYRVTMAQWGAGLGAYAYHVLGWRNAVTIGNIEPGPAGFIAEFCSLGGNIVERLWGDDVATFAREIPSKGVDGVFLPTSLGYASEDFVKVWARRHPDLGRWFVGGDGVMSQGLSAHDKRLLGVVASNPTPWASTRAWRTYTTKLAHSFPGFKTERIDALDYYDSVEPVAEALEQVHGDTSHGERRLMNALGHLDFQSPEGPRPLDAKHQAIGVSYLGKMAEDANGKLYVRPIRTVRGVDQTFGGYFSAARTPSQTLACVHGHPPAWATSAGWSK